MLTVSHRLTLNAKPLFVQLSRAERRELRIQIMADNKWARRQFYSKISGTWAITPAEFERVRLAFEAHNIALSINH